MASKKGPRAKFYLTAAIGIAVVTTFVLLGFNMLLSGDLLQFLITGLIALIVLALLAVFLRKMYSDMKKGLPHEDERSQRIKERAGFLTAMLTMYFCLMLAFVIDEAAERGTVLLITRHALEAVVVFEAVVFLALWMMLGRRG